MTPARRSHARFDVTIAVRNSEKTISRCLDSVLAAVPRPRLHSIVIVDNMSTDSTPAILAAYALRHPGLFKIVRHNGLLGSVRYRQAQECATPRILYVDSDVYLFPSWWRTISPYLTADTGWLSGKLKMRYPSKHLLRFFYWTLRRYGSVAFSNTLLLREPILRCTQLKSIHLEEDATLYAFFRARGLKAKAVDIFVAEHEPVGLHALWLRGLRAGQSARIHRGIWPALIAAAKSIYGDIHNLIVYRYDSGVIGIELIGMLALQRLAFCLGVIDPRIVRDVPS